MRNLKSLFGIILGMLLTMPFLTACGDDESIDLGTPKYESISGKYTINNPSSPYKSIELGAGGDYIVTLSFSGNQLIISETYEENDELGYYKFETYTYLVEK